MLHLAVGCLLGWQGQLLENLAILIVRYSDELGLSVVAGSLYGLVVLDDDTLDGIVWGIAE